MNISVVIPLYNKQNAIANTLQSVLSQQYETFEVVVIDDGSTDKSSEVVQGISDSRIRYIYKENGGPSSARNLGVRSATYEWIFFLDADDEIIPGTLQLFSDMVKSTPQVKMFNANFYTEFNGKKRLSSHFRKEGIVSNNFRAWFFHNLMPCQGATLYDKKLLLSNPYPEHLRRYEDAEMLFNLMRSTSIYTSKQPSFIYKTDLSSASKARKNIDEDFLGHLDFKNKSFWERMVLYNLYLQAVDLYPNQYKTIYKEDVLTQKDIFLYCIFSRMAWIVRKINSFLNRIKS